MLNYIWAGMLLMGFVIAIFNGKVDVAAQAAIASTKTAVELSIGLLGVMCLWTGLMKIAEHSGMIRLIAKTVRPFMAFIFPTIPRNHPAMGMVLMNLTANFLGLGNAATPLGIKAMGELQKINPRKKTSSDAMCMFLVLNTAAIQLVPATIIALRSAAGSESPSEIMGTIWGASLCATAVGIITVKILSAVWRDKL